MSSQTDGFGLGIAPRVLGKQIVNVTIGRVHDGANQYTGVNSQPQPSNEENENNLHLRPSARKIAARFEKPTQCSVGTTDCRQILQPGQALGGGEKRDRWQVRACKMPGSTVIDKHGGGQQTVENGRLFASPGNALTRIIGSVSLLHARLVRGQPTRSCFRGAAAERTGGRPPGGRRTGADGGRGPPPVCDSGSSPLSGNAMPSAIFAKAHKKTTSKATAVMSSTVFWWTEAAI